jgi:hypothetical protein
MVRADQLVRRRSLRRVDEGRVAEPYDLEVVPPVEEVEYLPVSSDITEKQGSAVGGDGRGRANPAMYVAVVLLVVLCAICAVAVMRLDALVSRTESLIVEQRRTTCYERLQWLGDSFGDHPEAEDLRAGVAQQCEGDDPLIEFSD